jgi:putative transposase
MKRSGKMNIEEPKDISYHRKGTVVYRCIYHVIFCPKYRRKLLVGEVEQRLKEIIKEVEANHPFTIIEMEVMPDHVHLLIDVDPDFGVKSAVARLKGTTSNILRKEFKHLRSKLPTLWTRSKFIASVGSVSLEVVKKYIEEQKDN